MNISLLVGLKNNLDYTKNFYNTTRELYPDVEICFTSYGSTDGTHEWLDSLVDDKLHYYYESNEKTFSDTFNMCAQMATSKYVALLHNDIILSDNFLENLEVRLSENNVVSYTTVEPPLFSDHERPGKIIRDFGTDLESFKKDDFREFARVVAKDNRLGISTGVSFFMALSRDVYINMGGMDNLFSPCFSEDDDFIARLSLQKLNLITCFDAICYHFVSKTSRFSDEFKDKTKIIEVRSNRNFFRKWGKRVNFSDIRRHNVGIEVKNCTNQILRLIEPICDHIYLNFDLDYHEYINEEQPHTKYNLSKKIKDIKSEKVDDYIVSFDGNQLSEESLSYLYMIQDMLKQINQPGSYQADIFNIESVRVRSNENSLIKIIDYDKDLFIL